MKSLANLLVQLLTESGVRCGVATSRDVKTLRARIEHEGISFGTITLSAYGKAFDQSLAAGRAVPDWPAVKRSKAGIPRFLEGFLHRVFDPKSGELRSNPDSACIAAVRQICRFLAKVELPCSDARNSAAVSAYAQTDKALPQLQGELSEDLDSPDELRVAFWAHELGRLYKGVAATLVALMPLEDEDGNVPVRCVHGPGATREGHTPNGKWTLREWHARLEEAGFTFVLSRFGAEKTLWGADRLECVPGYVDPSDEKPARVTLVPKTLKSPRVIAVEPCCMQFAQQGLAGVLRQAIDHCLVTSGRINFRDQEVNQRMALQGSVSGQYATIDLNEASDRVDCDLVEKTFWGAPKRFRDFLWASRSTRAELPDGTVVVLRKFASMGSAMCFPVESLVFFILIIAARLAVRGLPHSLDNIILMSQGVYVYGDDLVVPADETPAICAALEAAGLRVNTAKTFWTGKFRESCGLDAYDGQVVTPIYLRTCPTDRPDPSELVSLVSTARQLWKAGLHGTAQMLRKHVERTTGGLPEVPDDSPALGWAWSSDTPCPTRWNRHLQRRETRCLVVEPVLRPDPLEGEDAWVKCIRRVGGGEPPSWSWDDIPTSKGLASRFAECDPEHLGRSAMPYAITLKRRWVEL